jgi:hypothetical protein
MRDRNKNEREIECISKKEINIESKRERERQKIEKDKKWINGNKMEERSKKT